jgi:serine/threonine-protein kinase
MSPEQIRAEEVDARSDVYSLGILAYEMVTGAHPIQADTQHAMMNAQLNVMPRDPARVNPRVPRALATAIMRALAKDASQRFQTALEFRAALRAIGVEAAVAPGIPAPAVPSPTAVRSVELAQLEARLSRAIGPIAGRLVSTAARRYGTISEIRQALASEIEDPKERAAFLKAASGTTTDPSATATMATRPPSAPVVFDPAVLDRLTQALAEYIGPIAKVVVARAARTARSAEEFESALAAEIASPADRQRFLAVCASNR